MPRIQNMKARAGTTAEWLAAKAAGRKLDVRELGYDSTTRQLYVGDGTTDIDALAAVGSGTYARPSGISTSDPFTATQSRRLAGTANATYSIVGVDETSNSIFVVNTTNTRVVQSDDYGVNYSGSPRTLPSGVLYTGVSKIVRFGAHVYLFGLDTGDGLYKVWRATAVTRTGDWTDWSAALVTCTSGTAAFQGSLSVSSWASGQNYLFLAEYGDPTGGPAVWRSADGTTWTKVIANDATLRHYHHIAADPYNPGHVWLTAGDGVAKTVQRSTDSGATWTVAVIPSAWQGVQLSFSPQWVWVACDSRQGTAYVIDRATNTPYMAASNFHHFTPLPWGMGAAPRSVADFAVTSGSATATSATAAFTSADRGRYIYSGNAIPPGTYISAVGSGTSITMSDVAGATSSGRALTIGGDAYFAGAYWGAVDPSTGVYYCAAMDTSAQGTVMGLHYLPRPGARVEVLDPGGLNITMNTMVFILGGYLFCGQWRRPLLTTPPISATTP